MAGNATRWRVELNAQDVMAFRQAIRVLPVELRKDVAKRSLARVGTELRGIIQNAASRYRDTGTLARSIAKKVKIRANGNAYIIVGPSRKMVAIRVGANGMARRIRPSLYVHLAEFGTTTRQHTKGRKKIFVPWMSRSVQVDPKPGQRTGKVVGGRHITRAIESNASRLSKSLAEGVIGDLNQVVARIARKVARRQVA